MKKIKQIDLYIQIILLATWLLSLCFKIDYVLYGYFIVGSWHLISLIFYWVVGIAKNDINYKIITVVIAIIIGLLSLSFFINPLMYLTFIMLLIVSPILAIYHSFTCYLNFKTSKQRPLYQLK